MTMNVFVHHFIPPNDTMQDLIVDKCWMSECIGRPGSKPSCATNYSCDPEPTIYEASLFSYVQWRVKTRSAWLGGTVLLFPPAYTMVDVANYHLVLPCEPRRSLGPFWIQYIWLLLLIVYTRWNLFAISEVPSLWHLLQWFFDFESFCFWNLRPS